jgi:hypothetical protein
MKIEIKNRFTCKILFEFETENNTLKKTVEKSVKEEANLERANLERANLVGANLVGANLEGADLERADLERANLERANLVGADLEEANLERANLERANLVGADLVGANLEGANLVGANLVGANLVGANLVGAKYKDIIIKKLSIFTGLYKYIAMAIISEDNKYYIQLGCYTRQLSDWDNDFWNNPREFPNNGDLDSKYRLMAFEYCKQWIELNK